MNRLSTRLILSYIAIILLIILQMMGAGLALRYFNLVPDSPDLTALVADIAPETAVQMETMFREFFARQITLFVTASASIAIIAGVVLGRYLARPLNELARAARDIGAGNLNRRVSVGGADEIVAVATAFNEMAARLEQAETLRQNLLADVAHELRTPVTVIQGNLRAILDDVYPLEKEEVARLYEQTLQLTRLIGDLRELAQAEAHELPLNKTAVDVAQLVKDTAVLYKPLCQAQKITLRAELLGALPPLVADGPRLRQCLNNLLDNALRHTPSGGTITLQAEQVDGELQLRVEDTGGGIAPEHLAHVFDRFYRVDPARSRGSGGSGLGLAIVKAVAEAHNGRITVSSGGAGTGSSFVLHLPLEAA
jgi:signal transduction histidine kinase